MSVQKGNKLNHTSKVTNMKLDTCLGFSSLGEHNNTPVSPISQWHREKEGKGPLGKDEIY